MKETSKIHWFIYIPAIILCFPLGCIAAAYAAQVHPHNAQGNHKAAAAAYESAVNWCIWAYLFGLVLLIAYFLRFN